MKKTLNFHFIFFILLPFFNCLAQPCNSVQTITTSQQNELNQLNSQLANALLLEDFDQIDNLNNLIKTSFGAEGGKPDAIETYTNLDANTAWLELQEALSLSRQLISMDSLIYVDLWKVAKGMAPTNYQPHSIFLRASAEIAVGLLKIAQNETDLERKYAYQSWAYKALDSLATMQLPNGAFPFPDLRPYGDPVFSPIIQNYLNSLGSDSVLVLNNGWIIDDNNSGEFKFDAGVIGNAFYEAFQYSGNNNYKNIAIAVADYMLPLKMNVNYNYNTFVSLALTRGFQLTSNTTYLDRAILNIRYGVNPGQLENGRWVDGHNANSRYHNLILNNIAPTINLLPSSNSNKIVLDTMTVRAVENLLSYTNNCGAATGFRWLIATYLLNNNLFTQTTRNQMQALIGRYIQQADTNGNFLDIPTMGLYFDLLNSENLGNEFISYENIITSISPNPFSELTKISFELKKAQKIKLSLYDFTGKQVESIDIDYKNQGIYYYLYSGSKLEKGIYLLTLQTENGNFSSKMIKE